MKNKQAAIQGLKEILMDSSALEIKLNKWLEDQGLTEIDAPYGLASAGSRLEDMQSDIKSAIDEVKTQWKGQ